MILSQVNEREDIKLVISVHVEAEKLNGDVYKQMTQSVGKF